MANKIQTNLTTSLYDIYIIKNIIWNVMIKYKTGLLYFMEAK